MNGLLVASNRRMFRSTTIVAVAFKFGLYAQTAAAQYPLQTVVTTDRTVDAAEWLGVDKPGFADGAKFVFAASKKDDEAAASGPSLRGDPTLVAWGTTEGTWPQHQSHFVDGGILAVE